MGDIIKDAKHLAELEVPPLRAEITVHEDEDPRYVDDCLVQIIEKYDENSIWYEEEHGGIRARQTSLCSCIRSRSGACAGTSRRNLLLWRAGMDGWQVDNDADQ